MRDLLAISIMLQLMIGIYVYRPINPENPNGSVTPITTRKDADPKMDTIVFSKVEKKAGRFPWMYEWNKFIADEIIFYKERFVDNDSLYKRDLLRLCPCYYKATENQKIALWTLIFASIAKYESDFNPNTRFKEPPPLNVYSEGLLQL